MESRISSIHQPAMRNRLGSAADGFEEGLNSSAGLAKLNQSCG